jgi:hypothetical protein
VDSSREIYLRYAVYFQAGPGELANGIPVLPGHGLLPELLSVRDALSALMPLYERIFAAMLEKRPTWALETMACLAASLLGRLAGNHGALAGGGVAGRRRRHPFLARRLLKRESFSLLENLHERIASFIAYFNETQAKPFRWTCQGKVLNT